MSLATEATQHLEHDAFVYGSDGEYVRVLAPLVEAACGAGQRVVAAVPSSRAVALRDAVGSAASTVEWIDATQWYRRPAQVIAGYDRVLRAMPAGIGAFVIGEVQFGETEHDWREWTRYESALNDVLAGHHARVVCPYDERALPASVVADARRTHRHLVHDGSRTPSDRYTEPASLMRELQVDRELPARPADVTLTVDAMPADARRAFAAVARRAGVGDERINELTVAVNEVVTNALVHGGGPAIVRLWADRGVVVVVDDVGPGSDDLLLGLRPPPGDTIGGYGLWLTRQVFDVVELARSVHGGLRVYLEVFAEGDAAAAV